MEDNAPISLGLQSPQLGPASNGNFGLSGKDAFRSSCQQEIAGSSRDVRYAHPSDTGFFNTAVYKMRKAIVEPVFGQIKEQRCFRRFSLRGKDNVRREWKLVCAVSNRLKLFRAGGVLEMA